MWINEVIFVVPGVNMADDFAEILGILRFPSLPVSVNIELGMVASYLWLGTFVKTRYFFGVVIYLFYSNRIDTLIVAINH